jgi:hypothetical protein
MSLIADDLVKITSQQASAFKADSMAQAPIRVKQYKVMEHLLTDKESRTFIF